MNKREMFTVAWLVQLLWLCFATKIKLNQLSFKLISGAQEFDEQGSIFSKKSFPFEKSFLPPDFILVRDARIAPIFHIFFVVAELGKINYFLAKKYQKD